MKTTIQNLIATCLAFLLTLQSSCVLLVPLIEDDPFRIEPPVTQNRELITGGSRSPAKKATQHIPPWQQRMARLIYTLERGDDASRTNAATNLGYLPYHRQSVQALIRALRDKSKNVRRSSVKSLGRLKATEAIPSLKLALRDRDKYVAHSAEKVLKKFNSSSKNNRR